MNKHILGSLVLAGMMHAALRSEGVSSAMATGLAAGMFLIYWVKLAEGFAR